MVGYGNPLRGDDAIGQVVARAFAGADAIDGVEALACHQLTPELADRVAGVDLAVFIDAMAGAQPGHVAVSEVQVGAKPATAFAHSMEPSALLAVAKGLYGRSPQAFLVAVGPASFDLCDKLSDVVAAAVPKAIAAVRDLLSSAPNPALTRLHRPA